MLDVAFLLNRFATPVAIVAASVYVLVMTACAPSPEPNAVSEYHVAPDGQDANPGTVDRPFATLVRARDAVRQARATGRSGDIRVLIRGGVYQLTETVVFTTEDSAPAGYTTTYEAAPDEEPIFSAGVAVIDWQKADDLPPHLPESARGHVWVAPVPQGVGAFKTLYDGNQRLQRARGAGFNREKTGKGWHAADQHTFRFRPGAMHNWPDLGDVEVVLITAAPWTMNILPLDSVNEATREARTAIRGTYSLSQTTFGDFEHTTWVENTLAVLDEPGEWVLDSANRRIYYWPVDEQPSSNIVAPVLTELIRIEGDIDYDGPTDTPVEGLTFRGLNFTHADRYVWEEDRRGWGLQHDWEMFDKPSAMVRLRGAERCTVAQCRFANAGAAGVRLDLHCRDNTIDRNTFEHLGGVGVLLAGYGPGTKDVNKLNRVTANHIHHIGELYWHSPAIFIWQSGENQITNNLIHHVPYAGIVASGRIIWDRNGNGECSRTVRWAELESVLGAGFKPSLDWVAREPFLHSRKNNICRNEIHHVVETLTDGNGIYVSGAGGGNIVRENFIHDCPAERFAEGIRCDDDQYDTIVDRNIIWRLGGMATFVCIKGRNHVTNNIFAEPLTSPVRGMLSLEFVPNASIEGTSIQRNLFYTTRDEGKIVFQGQCYYKTATWLRDAEADRNLYFSSANPDWAKDHLAAEQKHGSEPNSIVADPMFVGPAQGDFRLRAGSPAIELGFEPIDMTAIGLPSGSTED